METDIATKVKTYSAMGGIVPEYSKLHQGMVAPSKTPAPVTKSAVKDSATVKPSHATEPSNAADNLDSKDITVLSIKERMNLFSKRDENPIATAPKVALGMSRTLSASSSRAVSTRPSANTAEKAKIGSGASDPAGSSTTAQQQNFQAPATTSSSTDTESSSTNVQDTKVTQRRTSVASRRESETRERIEAALPSPNTEQPATSPAVVETIQKLRNVAVVSAATVTDVVVPPVSTFVQRVALEGKANAPVEVASKTTEEVKPAIADISNMMGGERPAGTGHARYGSGRSNQFGPSVGGGKCATCSKTVYLVEQILYDDKVFHKGCLKCTHCNASLSLKSIASLEGQYYCKPHFKQLFKLKGNYAEGFGRVDHKRNWSEASTDSTL